MATSTSPRSVVRPSLDGASFGGLRLWRKNAGRIACTHGTRANSSSELPETDAAATGGTRAAAAHWGESHSAAAHNGLPHPAARALPPWPFSWLNLSAAATAAPHALGPTVTAVS